LDVERAFIEDIAGELSPPPAVLEEREDS